jgi:uncharacterized protein (TIGR02284 family)
MGTKIDPPEPPNASFRLSMGEIEQALVSQAFLAGLDQRHITTLVNIAQPVQFEEQALIFEAQQQAIDLYLLLSGSASVELNKGHFVVRIQYLEPGDAFGWSALLGHHEALFDVRTRERSTALRLDGARLAAALRDDNALAADILRRAMHLMAARLEATEERLAEFCGVPVKAREPESVNATIRILNKLIEVCLDGELGYRTAAQHIRSSRLRAIMTDHAIRRAQCAEDLRGEVERLGGSPGHSGSMAASLHRSWIALKAATLGGGTKAIVAACETGEDAACLSFGAAADSHLLVSETRPLIETQARMIEESREWLRQVHHELSSGAQLPELENGY